MTATSPPALELNTVLMNATFKLQGDGSTGTGFVIGRPMAEDATRAYYVLVTAAHVFTAMRGDQASIILRSRDQAGQFVRRPYPIQIRSGGTALWTAHPTADVAVMYLHVPQDAKLELLPTAMLATDAVLEQFEIHPGDTLSCLGFPYGFEANAAGFPVLRSGHIAGYPITPSISVKSILFDFNVFEGNSGGPVYFVESNRNYAGGTHIGKVQFLVGLVSEQAFLDEEIKSLSETRKTRHALGLGVVVPAVFIEQAIALLPAIPK